MKKVAILMAPGFEEIEALTVVDVLRRAGFVCDMVGFARDVVGSHHISVNVDSVWSGDLDAYDMVVLPGGMPGCVFLREREDLSAVLQQVHQAGKWIAAICAAPIVLEKAGLLSDRRFTCHDSVVEELTSSGYQKEDVVIDGTIITSRGPATALSFAYELVDQLGGKALGLKEAMLYVDSFDKS